MTTEERVDLIEDLKSKLTKAGSDRIFAGLKLKTEENKTFKDESLAQILKNDYENIDSDYLKILSQLRNLQHRYFVEIEFYSKDVNDNPIPFRKVYELHLTTDIQIDTVNDAPSTYMGNPLTQSLFSEISDFMQINYSGVDLLKVKRLD